MPAYYAYILYWPIAKDTMKNVVGVRNPTKQTAVAGTFVFFADFSTKHLLSCV